MELTLQMLLDAKNAMSDTYLTAGEERYVRHNGKSHRIVWTEWDEARVNFNKRMAALCK